MSILKKALEKILFPVFYDGEYKQDYQSILETMIDHYLSRFILTTGPKLDTRIELVNWADAVAYYLAKPFRDRKMKDKMVWRFHRLLDRFRVDICNYFKRIEEINNIVNVVYKQII